MKVNDFNSLKGFILIVLYDLEKEKIYCKASMNLNKFKA